MGKIVKYCAACDESFAEKFGFCPNCGKTMQAFEMNPLAGMTGVSESASNGGVLKNGTAKTETALPVFSEISAKVEPVKTSETANFSAVGEARTNSGKTQTTMPVGEARTPDAVETAAIPVKETKTFAASTANSNGDGYKSRTSGNGYRTVESQSYAKADDGFHVTVIEDKGGNQRNLLLLGSLFLMLALASGGMIYSLFNYNTSIAAIGDESGLSAPMFDETPMAVEEPPKPKDNKNAGGGGGGGRDEATPTSQGRLATQTDKPLIAPDKSIVQKDFELKQPVASTQGKNQVKPTEEPYGDPNSKYGLSSNGMGSGGGQGSGVGTGQGSGLGTGAGSGIGSGYGSGVGTGIGGGKGSGREGVSSPPPPPPQPAPKPAGVSTDIKIISKPGAKYTDAARQNQFSGTIRLRVTFTASGEIGSVSAVGNLPYGLTEQAIAAAKSIKFEPAKRDGVPITKIRQIDYTFTLY